MIIDHCRDLLEFQDFFYNYPMPKEQQFTFDWVINNPNLFCFYGELQFIVCKIARIHTSRGENWGELRGERLFERFLCVDCQY